MQKSVLIYLICLFLIPCVSAQDSIYFFKNGEVIKSRAIADMDSLMFTKPVMDENYVYDIDGNKYSYARVGILTWMLSNLNTTRLNDGTPIPYLYYSGAWAFNLSPAYCKHWSYGGYPAESTGMLYNWYAVNTDKLCPVGWHVPTESEWKILGNYPSSDEFKSLFTDSRYNDGKWVGCMDNKCTISEWWSSTEQDADNARGRYYHIVSNYVQTKAYIDSFNANKRDGHTVRCVKNY